MPAVSHRSDMVDRTFSALSSTGVNTTIGLLGLAVPIAALVIANEYATAILLAALAVVVGVLVARHAWLRRAYLQLRRANSRAMSDSRYFEMISAALERQLIDNYDEIADGNLRIFAGEVPRISVLLIRVLIESQSHPRQVLATDLTTNPRLLMERSEYLTMNQRFIDSGGSISRVFICYLSDLTRRGFARDLLGIVEQHRSMGVECGLAVRDRLSADQAVDFVVIAAAAVLVEDEQGDAGYRIGRSSVSFRGVNKWVARFWSVWQPPASRAAPLRLQTYESVVRPMLAADEWRVARVRSSLQ